MATPGNRTGASSSSRRYKYTKVPDDRKHPIRGLWKQNGNFERKLLTVGAEGSTKNREARRVDFNAELAAHLKAMPGRRAPDSQWLFPSRQRGERDEHTKTFRESLLLTRTASGWICMDCKKVTFSKETPEACPQCQGTRLEGKERACRSTCNGSASTMPAPLIIYGDEQN